MKKSLVAITLVAVVGLAQAGQLDNINATIKAWQPAKVYIRDGGLYIHAKERMVTKQIYQAMVAYGLCAKPENLKGIKETHVLNKHGHSGYVFEGGCGPVRKDADSVWFATHMH